MKNSNLVNYAIGCIGGMLVGISIANHFNKSQKAAEASGNYIERTESKTDTNGHVYAVEWRHAKGCPCLR